MQEITDDFSDVAFVVLNYCSFDNSKTATNTILNVCVNAKIVIVDNCSFDNSYQLLKEVYCNAENVFVIKNNNNNGYACGNNYGLKFLEELGDISIVGIVNPDVVVTKQAICDIVKVIKNNKEAAAVTAQCIINNQIDAATSAWKFIGWKELLFDTTLLGSFINKIIYPCLSIFNCKICLRGEYCRIPFQGKRPVRVDVVQGCFFMIDFKKMLKIGGFDEKTFLYHEENILAKKINKEGWSNYLIPNVVIYHNHMPIKSIASKSFHAKCDYESKIYYANNYLKKNCLSAFCLKFLFLDFAIKRGIFYIIKICKK